tara:strand:+ start:826 stop:963 length:138 start_codon:yes stop_codon:yes gene_type:complete
MINFYYCPVLGLQYWLMDKPLLSRQRESKKRKKRIDGKKQNNKYF